MVEGNHKAIPAFIKSSGEIMWVKGDIRTETLAVASPQAKKRAETGQNLPGGESPAGTELE